MQILVTISWPGDIDRGSETYGPFQSFAAAEAWITTIQPMLPGAQFMEHKVLAPFEVNA